MLVPEIKRVKSKKSKTNTIFIDDNKYGSPYNYEIVENDKEKDKFIKQIESIVRKSFEYGNYIGILKNELNLKKCTFLPNLNLENIKFQLEFHHYPFTLYDLCNIEVDYLLENNVYDINPYDIANKVISYHYKNIVGLVPLSVTIHQLCHDGSKFINTKYVIGEYKSYMKKKDKKIGKDFKDKISEIEKLSKMEDDGCNIDNNILDIITLEIVQENIKELRMLDIDKNEKVG